MLAAYTGQVRNGQPVISEAVTLPEDTSLIITVLDELPHVKTRPQRQNEALKRFFAIIDAIEDEPITDEDLAYFERNRVNLSRELDV